MWKSIGLIATGVLLGIVLLSALQSVFRQSTFVDRQEISVDAIESFSSSDVERARATGFVNIDSIEDVLALPTVFARREALYVLAGRSDAETLQKLIFDAGRISEKRVRDMVLDILFRGLSEASPRTALALSRVDPYVKDESLERIVWSTWARNNLDDAIFAVNAQTNRNDKERAAQSLYAAYGYMGSETTERIERELGIEADRQTRLRFLRTLLEESPERAIAFISQESSSLRRDEYINWLAYAIDTSDSVVALSYANFFQSPADKSLYAKLVEDRYARQNPIQILQQALATNDFGPNSDFRSAIVELVSQDMTEALNFYGQIEEPRAKMMTAFAIASEMAVADPAAALDWVRSLDGVSTQQLEGAVLARLAEFDPEFALSATEAMPASQRVKYITGIVATVARNDPMAAQSLLASLPDGPDTESIQERLLRTWLRSDPASAIDWLETLESEDASRIAKSVNAAFGRADPETAYRLLDFLEEPHRNATAQSLISQLAAGGNVSRAREIINELKAQEGFERLEVSLIGGLARNDSEAATALALQLQDEKERSVALSTIVSAVAVDNPRQAVSLLPNITDAGIRKVALNSIARQWYPSNPSAAMGWITSLPPGEDRDSVVSRLAFSFSQIGRREIELINSISDPESRQASQSMALLRLNRTDQPAALRFLESMDIAEDDKARLRERLRENSPQ